MAWYLNRALTNFRNAVNATFTNRDKTSDGTIGDAAHAATTSDHNPDPDGSVDAWDMDVDLRSDDDPAAIEMLKRVFQAHESSRYWIHNRVIASRSTGWRREPYTGANPHDKHVHWNTREQFENSTDPWEVDFMATINQADWDALIWRVAAMANMTPTYGGGGSQTGKPVPFVAAIKALAGDQVDEQAIVAGVLAGLAPERIADLVVAALPPDLARQLAQDLAARLAE